MAKDKPGAASTKKTAAKAQKKTKAAQKTARKEKKKATKSQRDKDDQEDEDLEDILEKVHPNSALRVLASTIIVSDQHSYHDSSRYDKNGRQHIRSRKNLWKDLRVDVLMPL